VSATAGKELLEISLEAKVRVQKTAGEVQAVIIRLIRRLKQDQVGQQLVQLADPHMLLVEDGLDDDTMHMPLGLTLARIALLQLLLGRVEELRPPEGGGANLEDLVHRPVQKVGAAVAVGVADDSPVVGLVDRQRIPEGVGCAHRPSRKELVPLSRVLY